VEATGEFLCLINNDLIFEKGWLEPLLQSMQEINNVGIVGNLQYRVSDNSIDHAGVRMLPNGQFEHIRHETTDMSPKKVLAITGACLLIRNSDFVEIGGFDEVFLNGCEDYDLCFSVSKMGKSVYVVPQSRIKHHVSLSRGYTPIQNERNSQHLYNKWRKKIKFELARLWVEILRAGHSSYEPYIYGELLPEFIALPQAAARIIAESMLLKEEAHWARELGSQLVNGDWIGRVIVTGLRPIPQVNASLPEGEVELVIDGLASSRNFYVCGRRTDEYVTKRVAITLTSNDIQEQTFFLGDDLNINVGLINPILVSGAPNRLKMAVYFVDEHGQQLEEANQSVLITHFVVDDQRIEYK
jgi:hypothetical protein